MGRRSINTTKSGKYMNPTDQASEYLKKITKFLSPIYFSFRKRG